MEVQGQVHRLSLATHLFSCFYLSCICLHSREGACKPLPRLDLLFRANQPTMYFTKHPLIYSFNVRLCTCVRLLTPCMYRSPGTGITDGREPVLVEDPGPLQEQWVLYPLCHLSSPAGYVCKPAVIPAFGRLGQEDCTN